MQSYPAFPRTTHEGEAKFDPFGTDATVLTATATARGPDTAVMDDELQILARRFSHGPQEFTTSPLYGRLCSTAAANPQILSMLTERRPGVQPTNLLMAAVHHSLLQDPAHELARWFPSVCTEPVRPPETAGPTFVEFCRDRHPELLATVRRRLVQTNVPKRCSALLFGLAAIPVREPITLIEIGASAGLLLRFDEYGYRIAGKSWGRTDSPVQIETEFRGSAPCPDLGRLPEIRQRAGIDLNPIDATDPRERGWLRALIWPENTDQARLLMAALDIVAVHPPDLRGGDAVSCLPAMLDEVPAGSPVVVFHAATLAHVPTADRPAFRAAIENVAATHELFHLSLEGFRDSRWLAAHALELLHIRGSERSLRRLAALNGHGDWIEPC